MKMKQPVIYALIMLDRDDRGRLAPWLSKTFSTRSEAREALRAHKRKMRADGMHHIGAGLGYWTCYSPAIVTKYVPDLRLTTDIY